MGLGLLHLRSRSFRTTSRCLKFIDHARLALITKTTGGYRCAAVLAGHSDIYSRREFEPFLSDPLTDLALFHVAVLHYIGDRGIPIVKQVFLDFLELLLELFTALRTNSRSSDIIKQSSAFFTILNIHYKKSSRNKSDGLNLRVRYKVWQNTLSLYLHL